MRYFLGALFGFLVLSSAPIVWAQAKDSEILLWKVPRTGSAALLPNISLIGSFAGAYFRDEPVGETGENPGRTGFNLQSLELAIQADIDPYVRGDIFIVFKEDEVEVEEARLTTLSLPAGLQVQAGILLPRLGRLNTQHLEQWDFVDQSFTNRYFLGVEGFAELGAELSWLIPTPWYSELSFAFLQGDNEDNFDGPRKGDFAYLGHWDNFFDVTQNLSLKIGLSGALGFNATAPGNETQIYVADFYWRWRPSERLGLKWQTEYFLRRREVVGGTEQEGGLYSQLVFQVARRWELGLRVDHIGWPAEGFRQTALSPALTFLASEYFRLRTQYNYITAMGVRPNHQVFLQAQFNMGSHGAHQF